MQSEIIYKVDFKKKTNLSYIIVIGISLIFWILILTTIILDLIHVPVRGFALLLFIIILSGIWMVDRFLWHIRGIEELLISDQIEIIKSGKLFRSVRRIGFNEYESVSFDNDQRTPAWTRIFGLRGGKIKIRYLGKVVRVGQDISLTLAEIITQEIADEVKRIKNKYE